MKNPHGMSYGAAIGVALAARAIVRRLRAYDLRDRIALITGGSRGLGLVIARELVQRGTRVAICARRRDELERARAELVQRGGTVLAVECDLADPQQIATLVALVTDQLGPIDVLINNAGAIQVGPMELMNLDDYAEAMATHFWAPLRLIHAVLPSMIERRSGRIVNVASIGGKIATRLYALAPGLAQRVLAVIDRLLPRPGGIGAALAPGSLSESPLAPSILTRSSDRAAIRNNE